MRRRLKNTEPENAKPPRMEPLAEGLAGPAARRNWRLLSDGELVAYAKSIIAGRGVKWRWKLREVDSGLYQALRKRKQLDNIGLEEKLRDWGRMGEDELVAYARKFVAESKITGRRELAEVDPGLYGALRRRKLLEEAGLEGKQRDWARMERGELVAFAKRFIAGMGIKGRGELAEADLGLYQVLMKRGLHDMLGLEGKLRDWDGMGKDGLVALAKKFIADNGINGRKELKNSDSGLYQALRKRKLLDDVGLPNSNEKHRDWDGMGKDGLVALAKKFIADNGISGRKELKNSDSGLYQALRKRKQIDAVFSNVISPSHKEAVDGVLSALDSFGDGE